MRTSIPVTSDIEIYNLQVWMMNENSQRISESYSFKVKTLEATEDESSNTLVFAGVLVFGLLSVGYIYRNYSYDDEDYDDDYEDDYDDTQYQELDEFDNTQQSAATVPEASPQIQEPEVQVPVDVVEPVQVAETTSVAPVQEVSPEVKTRKKWFGLFGPQIPVDPYDTDTAVSQPVAAEPVVAEAVVISEAEDET